MSDIERLEREAKERRERRKELAVGVDTADLIREHEAALDEALAGWKEAERLLAIGDRAYGRVMDERDQARADVKKLRESNCIHDEFVPLCPRCVALAETDREEYR